ncbi:hypothetical protein B0H13DRAFT_1098390 [Mycena leptocephala]|nr:hypothetical protein B0H13DRAFT_1098390 [Mycena leptocephala]
MRIDPGSRRSSSSVVQLATKTDRNAIQSEIVWRQAWHLSFSQLVGVRKYKTSLPQPDVAQMPTLLEYPTRSYAVRRSARTLHLYPWALEARKLCIDQLLPSTPAVLSCPQTAEALVLAPSVSLKEAALSVDTTKHTTVPNYSGINLRRAFQIYKNSGDMWVKNICYVKSPHLHSVRNAN